MSKLDQKIQEINTEILELADKKSKLLAIKFDVKGGEGSGRYPAGSGGGRSDFRSPNDPVVVAKPINDPVLYKEADRVSNNLAKIRDTLGSTDEEDTKPSKIRDDLAKIQRGLEAQQKYKLGSISPEVDKALSKIYDDVYEVRRQADSQSDATAISPEVNSGMEKLWEDVNSLYDQINDRMEATVRQREQEKK